MSPTAGRDDPRFTFRIGSRKGPKFRPRKVGEAREGRMRAEADLREEPRQTTYRRLVRRTYLLGIRYHPRPRSQADGFSKAVRRRDRVPRGSDCGEVKQ